VQNSEGQMFLQEIVSEEGGTRLVVTSLKGQKIVNNPIDEELRITLCDKFLESPIWCITNQV